MEAGSTLILTCVGYGDPTVSVSWSMENVQLDNSSQTTIYEEAIIENGLTLVQSVLVICSVDETDSGQYSCTVANALGNASVDFEVSVTGKCIVIRLFRSACATFRISLLHRPSSDTDPSKPDN